MYFSLCVPSIINIGQPGLLQHLQTCSRHVREVQMCICDIRTYAHVYRTVFMCVDQCLHNFISWFETSEDLCIFFMRSLLVHPLSLLIHLYQLKHFHSNHKMRETIHYKLHLYIYLCVHMYHCTTYVTSRPSLNLCFILNCGGYMYSVYCEW